MKNIEVKDVEKLREWAQAYKNYKVLYDQTAQMAEGKKYSEYGDIMSTIKDHIEETLDDIAQLIDEMYEDWSGISEARKKFRKTHEFGDTAFCEIEDEIRYKDEQIDGECRDMVGIVNELYNKMYSTPINFMKEFVAEYGIFIVDDCNDVWVA